MNKFKLEATSLFVSTHVRDRYVDVRYLNKRLSTILKYGIGAPYNHRLCWMMNIVSDLFIFLSFSRSQLMSFIRCIEHIVLLNLDHKI